jgi:hypothetical protein
MTQWFTLRFKTKEGRTVELFNLQAAGCDSIVGAQTALGSTEFVRREQRKSYSQIEIDLLRAREADPAMPDSLDKWRD